MARLAEVIVDAIMAGLRLHTIDMYLKGSHAAAIAKCLAAGFRQLTVPMRHELRESESAAAVERSSLAASGVGNVRRAVRLRIVGSAAELAIATRPFLDMAEAAEVIAPPLNPSRFRG
jgi:hypothetical protein